MFAVILLPGVREEPRAYGIGSMGNQALCSAIKAVLCTG